MQTQKALAASGRRGFLHGEIASPVGFEDRKVGSNKGVTLVCDEKDTLTGTATAEARVRAADMAIRQQ